MHTYYPNAVSGMIDKLKEFSEEIVQTRPELNR